MEYLANLGSLWKYLFYHWNFQLFAEISFEQHTNRFRIKHVSWYFNEANLTDQSRSYSTRRQYQVVSRRTDFARIKTQYRKYKAKPGHQVFSSRQVEPFHVRIQKEGSNYEDLNVFYNQKVGRGSLQNHCPGGCNSNALRKCVV